MSNLIEMEEVRSRLNDSGTVIVDCRFALGQPSAGREAYMQSHLPGAFYFDLDQDLSAPIGVHGGRHPLPDLEELAQKLRGAGISEDTDVIAYDDQGGAMASRFWWLLRYLGHSRVQIMDGSFVHWKAADYPVTAEMPELRSGTFQPRPQDGMLLRMEDVKAGLGRQDRILIDSREGSRYLGEEEAIDPVAGHIPGAVNRFWKEGLTVSGRWQDAEGQWERFKDLDPEKEVVVYCGSGVTACPNVLALEEAGFENVKLYAGSWSDWISYKENPVATGEE